MGDTGTKEGGNITKKPSLTPKSIINLKYGDKAVYKTEVIQGPTSNICPGLALKQQGPIMYRCCLELPEISVVSGLFSKKKDAEQDAAKIVVEKLGISSKSKDPTIDEAWNDLIGRVSYLFSDEFISSAHPLTAHLVDALDKNGNFCGLLPVSILAACDSKLNNLCKAINPMSESNILLTVLIIMQAASKSGSLVTSNEKLWIHKQVPYSLDMVRMLLEKKSNSSENFCVEAILVPCSMEKSVIPISLNINSDRYYMDVIAEKLGHADTSRTLVSRVIGKASSELRLYFAASTFPLQLDLSLNDLSNGSINFATALNERACYFSGQDVYGDAILASVGYKWKSTNLYHEDLSLEIYYRMLTGRLPNGGLKLSRKAILAGELPTSFTTYSNWRGSLPRDLLCTFCRLNWLLEPNFSTGPENMDTGSAVFSGEEPVDLVGGTYRCEVEIYTKAHILLLKCSPEDSYKKQGEAIQNCALKVLLWLTNNFKQLHISSIEEDLSFEAIHFYPHNLSKSFALCVSVHTGLQNSVSPCLSSESNGLTLNLQQHDVHSLSIEGSDSGVSPSKGLVVCISYVVSLLVEGGLMKEILESNEEFEFEIGTGAAIPQIEACVTQMSINQSASFITGLFPLHFILSAARDTAKVISLLSSDKCHLEYSINLLRVSEPLEDRMEHAFFSPPLSKQRVEYALGHIVKSSAANLIDFGCGSGSLLDSLLDHPTTLEKIVGVDISRKSLGRAAKVLHSKLASCTSIQSAVLYDGSITVFDSRLYGFDIGTCLEVIEHMEEDQARLFGDLVLSTFCPTTLIVSTPNYEYNRILQRGDQDENEGDGKTEFLPCKFRNNDHKFEWTREQFNSWASALAVKHNYTVEFSGVGGSADFEPGFASQIAVFSKCKKHEVDNKHFSNGDLSNSYEIIWEWSRKCNGSSDI